MNPLFSIITISYNSAKTIERTLKSVLNQTYNNYEYIIIDGVSTDGTLDIIKKYEPLFKGRLRWESEPDSGIYNAMNKGIKYSSGDIIGIVNSDDWLEENALDEVKKAFEKNNRSSNSIYCGWINFIDSNGSSIVFKTDYNRFKKKASSSYTMDGIRHPAVFVPKAIYNKYGLFDEEIQISADADFILRLYFASIDFKFIEKPLSNMSDGGISNCSHNRSVRKKTYRDYSIRLSKYPLSLTKKVYLKGCFLIRQRIKGLLSSRLIKIIRSVK